MPAARMKASTNNELAERPAEEKLLLQLSRTTLTADDRRQALLLFEHHVDWERLVNLGAAHGTLILIWQHLNALAPKLIETVSVLHDLKKYRPFVSMWNRQLAEELLTIYGNFRAHGIELIPYKGLVLAVQAYGDLEARYCIDLDILVPRGQAVAAMRLLSDLGYLPHQESKISLELALSGILQKLTHEITFVRSARSSALPPNQIDLHWEVSPPHTLSLEFNYLLEHCTEIELCGQKIRSLKPELVLVTLCTHGTKHRWMQMRWIVDVVELLQRNPALDWEEVYRVACKHGISKKIDLALLLCSAAFGTKLPEPLSFRVQEQASLVALCETIIRCWLVDEVMADNLRNYWKVEMLTSDSVAKCWSFMMHEIFRPTVPTYLKYVLPEKLFPLYYLIHPALTIGQFIGARSKE